MDNDDGDEIELRNTFGPFCQGFVADSKVLRRPRAMTVSATGLKNYHDIPLESLTAKGVPFDLSQLITKNEGSFVSSSDRFENREDAKETSVTVRSHGSSKNRSTDKDKNGPKKTGPGILDQMPQSERPRAKSSAMADVPAKASKNTPLPFYPGQIEYPRNAPRNFDTNVMPSSARRHFPVVVADKPKPPSTARKPANVPTEMAWNATFPEGVSKFQQSHYDEKESLGYLAGTSTVSCSSESESFGLSAPKRQISQPRNRAGEQNSNMGNWVHPINPTPSVRRSLPQREVSRDPRVEGKNIETAGSPFQFHDQSRSSRNSFYTADQPAIRSDLSSYSNTVSRYQIKRPVIKEDPSKISSTAFQPVVISGSAHQDSTPSYGMVAKDFDDFDGTKSTPAVHSAMQDQQAAVLNFAKTTARRGYERFVKNYSSDETLCESDDVRCAQDQKEESSTSRNSPIVSINPFCVDQSSNDFSRLANQSSSNGRNMKSNWRDAQQLHKDDKDVMYNDPLRLNTGFKTDRVFQSSTQQVLTNGSSRRNSAFNNPTDELPAPDPPSRKLTDSEDETTTVTSRSSTQTRNINEDRRPMARSTAYNDSSSMVSSPSESDNAVNVRKNVQSSSRTEFLPAGSDDSFGYLYVMNRSTPLQPDENPKVTVHASTTTDEIMPQHDECAYSTMRNHHCTTCSINHRITVDQQQRKTICALFKPMSTYQWLQRRKVKSVSQFNQRNINGSSIMRADTLTHSAAVAAPRKPLQKRINIQVIDESPQADVSRSKTPSSSSMPKCRALVKKRSSKTQNKRNSQQNVHAEQQSVVRRLVYRYWMPLGLIIIASIICYTDFFGIIQVKFK